MDQTLAVLTQIVEKTHHIRAGLISEDEDMVLTAVEERDDLIKAYVALSPKTQSVEIDQLLKEIQSLDQDNEKMLKAFMKKVEHEANENKVQLAMLQKGKQVANKYENPYSRLGGSVLDLKK